MNVAGVLGVLGISCRLVLTRVTVEALFHRLFFTLGRKGWCVSSVQAERKKHGVSGWCSLGAQRKNTKNVEEEKYILRDCGYHSVSYHGTIRNISMNISDISVPFRIDHWHTGALAHWY